MWLSDEQLMAIATALASSKDSAIVSSEGCEHLFKVRWQEGKSVCLLCREVIHGENPFTLCVESPKSSIEVVHQSNIIGGFDLATCDGRAE